MTTTKKIEDGGPVFPHPGGANDVTVQTSHLGLSLRDWFAAQALPPMVAMLVGASTQDFAGIAKRFNLKEAPLTKVASLMAYEQADAMLIARKSGGEA